MKKHLRSETLRTVLLGVAASLIVFGGSQMIGEASPLGATAPTLGAAASFAVLGGSTVTNTGASTIRADLGVSPGSAVTGFPPGQVIGGTIHTADGVALQAQNDTTTAYNALVAQPCTADLTGQDLGAQLPLVPGVYCFTSSAQLTGALTLAATGNGVYVFKIGSTLTTASNSSVLLTGGSPCNVFWQVGSSATLGTGTRFVGNILALTSITLTTGASVNGRTLARGGAVTLDTNDVGSTGCTVGLNTPLPATATAIAAQTATAAAAAATATALAAPPPPAPFRPSQPAPTANLPLGTPTVIPATATAIAAATATASTAGTATAVAAGRATAIAAAALVATAPPATSTPVLAATATPTAVAPNALTAPAPAPQVSIEQAATPTTSAPARPGIPSTLPRTGGGLPAVGIYALLLGSVALVLALTVGRTRK